MIAAAFQPRQSTHLQMRDTVSSLAPESEGEFNGEASPTCRLRQLDLGPFCDNEGLFCDNDRETRFGGTNQPIIK
jgi:hypothetical protein